MRKVAYDEVSLPIRSSSFPCLTHLRQRTSRGVPGAKDSGNELWPSLFFSSGNLTVAPSMYEIALCTRGRKETIFRATHFCHRAQKHLRV